MAKQTFTTGQVLTAAQMTSLQQTAMLGGAASAKTASYTLVAADAGTAISMDSASATTITVNTALFAAGDTVQITNLGAGVCTITAGTATVNTSASLALAQYESGTLDFTSTSAAIFIKGAGAAAAGGGMTLINTGGTTLTGASVTVSAIPDTYVNLFVIIRAYRPANDGAYLMMRFNGDSNANRHFRTNWATEPSAQAYNGSEVEIVSDTDNGTSNGLVQLTFFDYANTTTAKYAIGSSFNNNITTPTQINARTRQLFYNQTAAISSLSFFPDSGNFTSGTVFVYGVK
jgi:hypothetical protein